MFQVLPVIIVQRGANRRGRVQLLTPKLLWYMQTNYDPSDWPWCLVFMWDTSSRILLRSHGITVQRPRTQWLPNPSLSKPKTTYYTEARHSCPTTTCQATSCSFSQVSACTKRHWWTTLAVNYLCSACKNSTRTTVHKRQLIACLASSWGCSLSQVPVRVSNCLPKNWHNIKYHSVSVPAGYEASNTLCAASEIHFRNSCLL